MIPKPGSITKLESALIAAALAVLSLVLLRPSIRGHDGPGHFVYLRSILLDGDLDLLDDYIAFDRLHQETGDPGFRLADAPISEATGKAANRYGIGAALFWAPFVYPVHLLVSQLAPELADGMSAPYQLVVGTASAFWACLALWLLYARIREEASRSASLLAIGSLVFSTPLAFYVWAHGSMSHAVSFFVVTCAGLSLERFMHERKLFMAFVTGCWCGMIIVVRAQDATWAIVLMSALLGCALCTRADCLNVATPNRVLVLTLTLMGFLLALFPQMAVWKILYGGWLTGPAPYLNREGGSFSVFPIHIFSALFSGRHGALSWHPVLIAGLIGLVLMSARGAGGQSISRRGIAFVGLVGFAAQAWLVGCWSMWWAGASFGNRFFISSYPLLLFGLVALLSKLEARGRVRGTVLALAILIAWNVGLAIQYGSEMIPREAPVSMLEIITNQFTKVPVWIIDRVR